MLMNMVCKCLLETHMPYTLSTPAMQTFSRSFLLANYPLATGPLHVLMLLPGFSPFSFPLVDN